MDSDYKDHIYKCELPTPQSPVLKKSMGFVPLSPTWFRRIHYTDEVNKTQTQIKMSV